MRLGFNLYRPSVTISYQQLGLGNKELAGITGFHSLIMIPTRRLAVVERVDYWIGRMNKIVKNKSYLLYDVKVRHVHNKIRIIIIYFIL